MGWLKKYQQGGKKDKALSIEGRVNKWLNDPQGKARKDAENKSGDGDEEIDNIRHASAGRYTAEAIANKTGNIPYVSKPLGVIGANIMGLGHEIGTYVTDPRWTDKNWKVSNFDKAKVISRELLEDAYNNFAGSVIGATDMTPEQKTARIKYLSQNYMIPDGYGLLHPYGDNPTFVDPYSKKKYGGYSTTGYKANSPDKDNPYNIIPSGRITMQNVPHPVLGIDNLGNRQMMMPGGEYQFQGNEVFEMPVMKEGGTVPTINDAGNFKNGVWVPDLATIKQQAKKLGSRTVKTKSGSIINFDENWNIKGVDDAPTMQGGGVPPFITSDIDEYNYRKARQLDSNYLNKNLRSYFNKNAQKFHNEHTVPWDPYASKLNPFGPKTYSKEELNKMTDVYETAKEKNKDELLKNISRNLQIKNINKFIDVDNYINSHAYKQYYPQEDFIQDERAIGHLSVPQKNPYSGIWSNAYFSHPYQIAEDFPAATQEVIFDSKAPKSTGNKKAVKKLVPTVPTEKVSVSQIPVADMQQFPILQSAQQYANYAQVPVSPYSVNVHKWDPMLLGRQDEVKDFMTQEQLEAWKRASRAHALGTGRYETGINQQPSQDGTISFSPQMKEGGIPERYKNMGFTHVGQKKAGDGQHKWKVLAKKGDSYKVVQGGYRGMQDFKQHGSEERRDRFWDRMGGKNSSKAKDPFSPLYWHKRFGTWEYGGPVPSSEMYKDGGMIKRADGSYSQRGLWDNIRANAGSGKKPTKEMLQQEKKIRAAEKKEYGGWLNEYQEGGRYVDGVYNPYADVVDKLTAITPQQMQMLQMQAKQNQSTIRPSSGKRSTLDKMGAITRNPVTALGYAARGQQLPDYFEKGARNPYDYAADVLNPMTYIDVGKRTATLEHLRNMKSLQDLPGAAFNTGMDVGALVGLGSELRATPNILPVESPTAYQTGELTNAPKGKMYGQNQVLVQQSRLLDPKTKAKFFKHQAPAVEVKESMFQKTPKDYNNRITPENYDDFIKNIHSYTDYDVAASSSRKPSNLGIGNYGKQGKVFSDAPLNNLGKDIINAHEKNHGIFAGTLSREMEEGLLKPFGTNKPVPHYAAKHQADEVLARMAQFKNAVGMSDAQVFTKGHLDLIRKNYADQFLDNGIKEMLQKIKPGTQGEKEFLKNMNKYAFGTIGLGAGVAASQADNQKYGGWLSKYK